jgi:hypothetical protein
MSTLFLRYCELQRAGSHRVVFVVTKTSDFFSVDFQTEKLIFNEVNFLQIRHRRV